MTEPSDLGVQVRQGTEEAQIEAWQLEAARYAAAAGVQTLDDKRELPSIQEEASQLCSLAEGAGMVVCFAREAATEEAALQVAHTAATPEKVKTAVGKAVKAAAGNRLRALRRVVSGIVTRQIEVLRTYRIAVNFEQEFIKQRRQLGRELTDQEKTQTAICLILREGASLEARLAVRELERKVHSLNTEYGTRLLSSRDPSIMMAYVERLCSLLLPTPDVALGLLTEQTPEAMDLLLATRLPIVREHFVRCSALFMPDMEAVVRRDMFYEANVLKWRESLLSALDRTTSDLVPSPVPDLRSRIKEFRIKVGWTQTKLAEQVGVTYNTVQNWENGRSVPRLEIRQRLLAIITESRP